MVTIDGNSILQWHSENKQHDLHGRWITLTHTEPVLKKLTAPFTTKISGSSTLGAPIYEVTIGSGDIPILIWSQMHGNESTGTKAVFDLFKFLEHPQEHKDLRDQILAKCRITILPMVNPDGAEAYTRVNASEIDLNRDVLDKKAPESKLLFSTLKEVDPQYCFNLHDQRTIFTVGDTKKSASLSFLAPAEDEERTITEGRKETMKVIVAMNTLLQQLIPGQIGRYTDEFYPTATGDNFQKIGHNTILIEAGHDQDDYERERVRAYNFIALLQGLNYICSKAQGTSHEPYFDIPKNTEYYFDRIYKNVFLTSENKEVDVGVRFKEVLKNGTVIFDPEIQRMGDLKNFNANTFIREKGLVFENTDQLQRFLKKTS